MFVSRRRLAAFVLVIVVLTQPYPVAFGELETVILHSGTPVFVVVESSIDSETVEEGDLVYFRVMRPVIVDGVVVIRTGEKVTALVKEVEEASGWGARGNLTVRVDSTTSVDKQVVFLTATQHREGKGKGGTATAVGVGLGLLCFPLALIGFAVHGEEGKLPAGYEIKAYVDTDYKINLAEVERVSPAEERKRVRELEREIEHKIREEKRLKEEEEKKEREEQEDKDLMS